MTTEEFAKKLEESGDYIIYYMSPNNLPDYGINTKTNEMIIFSYGYSFTAEAKSIDDYEHIDCTNNLTKKFIFEELDRRLENAIDEYNKCLAHYTRSSSENNSIELSNAKGVLNTLEELREEFSNEHYW